MSALIQEIEELEKNTRMLNSVIENVMGLKSWVKDVEGGEEGSGRRLANKVKEMIEQYESMSTGAIFQIKAKGFAEERVRKYSGSTYENEIITSCRIDKNNQVFVITNKGMFAIGTSEESDMYNFWADGLLLEFQGTDKLEVSKY